MSKIKRLSLRWTTFVAAVLAAPVAYAVLSDVSYKKEIQPIFNEFCVTCHVPGGEGFEASGLDLRNYRRVMTGTKHGPIIVPGSAFTSNLMVLMEGRADPSISMPHNIRPDLTSADRKALRTWINKGATEKDFAKVLPVFETHCVECHTGDGIGLKTSGLDMSSYQSLMKGTAHGSVIIPGDAVLSNLMVLVEGRAGKKMKMPHNTVGLPSERQKVLLRRWINQGAKNN